MSAFTLSSAAALSARRLLNPRGSNPAVHRGRVAAAPPRASILGKVMDKEFEAAKAAILQVHPDANVVGNRIDEYPITVTVSKGELVMWSGRQQGLFSRNGRRAQADIIAALEEAREQ